MERGEMKRRGERQMRTILSVECQTFTAAADQWMEHAWMLRRENMWLCYRFMAG